MEIKLKTKPSFHPLSRLSQLCVSALAGVSIAAVACGGGELEHRDLGNTTVSESNERTSVLNADGTIDPSLDGHWVGQAEDLLSPAGPDGERPAYTFPSGSTQISLSLEALGIGQISFGEGPMPEPVAGIAYPPGLYAHTLGVQSPLVDAPLPPLEGFTYQFLGGHSSPQGGFSLQYAANESYRDWCALQPATPNGSGFDCITPLPKSRDACFRDKPRPGLYYDCSLGWLCQARNVCTCTEAGCEVAAGTLVTLWLMRSGEDLIGSFAGAVLDYGTGSNLPMGNVRFQRQAP